MKTTITKKGQTVVPSSLRKKYGLTKGSELEWIDTGDLLKIFPLPRNLIKSLRGSAKGENLTQKMLKARKEDKNLEKIIKEERLPYKKAKR